MEKIKQELTSINKIMLDSKMPKGQINFLKQRVDLLTSKVQKIAKKHKIDLSDIYGA